MVLQESGEMYLESILVLIRQGKAVRSIDIVDYMGYSKPSVSRAVGILKKNGYIIMDGSGHLYLTDEGRSVAEKTFERHRVLTKVFTKLGVSAGIAAEDACKIEHVLSSQSFQAIKKHITQGNELPADMKEEE